MPIYQYRCEFGHEFEDLEPITAPSERECGQLDDDPECGDPECHCQRPCEGTAKRVPSIPAPAQFNCHMPTYQKPRSA